MLRNRPKEMIGEMVNYIFENHDIDVVHTKRRYESVVISRAALFNACRGFLPSTQLASYFEMNHATILHHNKNHKSLLMIDYYRQLFFALSRIRNKYDDVAQQHHDDVVAELEDLKRRYRQLMWEHEQLKMKHHEESREEIHS